jgi:hypothetical protein
VEDDSDAAGIFSGPNNIPFVRHRGVAVRYQPRSLLGVNEIAAMPERRQGRLALDLIV